MFLSKEELQLLSKRDNLIVFRDIIINWLVIIVSYVAFRISDSFLVLFFAGFVTATRIHALMIIAHDCSHNLFLKNKHLSDFLSTLLCSITSGMITNRYRAQHLDHHKYLQTQKDPFWVAMRKMDGWTYPKEKGKIKKILLEDLLGLRINEHKTALLPWSFLPKILIGDEKVPRLTSIEILAITIFASLIFGIPVFINEKLFLVQYAIGLSFLPVITRVRAITEHYPLEKLSNSATSELFHTFTVSAGLLERFIIAPHNICRHLEHHLYPTIPYYNLEKAHGILISKPEYKKGMFELDGYLSGKRNAFTVLSKDIPYPQDESKVVNL